MTQAEEILETTQWIARPITEVFAFFSDEKNLEAITPEWLRFHVVGKSTPRIENGTLIEYKLSLHGLPLHWQSRIEAWEPAKRFVDVQIRGPYSLWEHTHTFEEARGGTLVRDRVRYRLPFGKLGQLVAGKKVKRDLAAIFEYRKKRIGNLLA